MTKRTVRIWILPYTYIYRVRRNHIFATCQSTLFLLSVSKHICLRMEFRNSHTLHPNLIGFTNPWEPMLVPSAKPQLIPLLPPSVLHVCFNLVKHTSLNVNQAIVIPLMTNMNSMTHQWNEWPSNYKHIPVLITVVLDKKETVTRPNKT